MNRIARQEFREDRLRRTLLGVVVGLLLVWSSPGRACYETNMDSVHFYYSGYSDKRHRNEDHGSTYEDSARVNNRRSQRMEERAMEIAGLWSRARRKCEEIAHRFGFTGNLRGMLEVLRRVEAMPAAQSPAFTTALQLYLNGMESYDEDRLREAQAAFEQVYADPNAGFLREYARYQQASIAYEWMDFPRAVELYQKLLSEFPNTVKKEAALIMIARCALLPATREGRRMEAGKAALSQLKKQFPHSRFQEAAIGLQARIDYLEGRFDSALRRYAEAHDMGSVEIVYNSLPQSEKRRRNIPILTLFLRELNYTKADRNYTVQESESYHRALVNIDLLRKRLNASQAAQFSQEILRQPELGPAYLSYRLDYTETKPADLKHLAQLADAVIARYSPLHLTRLARVRLAEVYYQQKQYHKALTWANRALMPSTTPPFDRALFVLGGTLHKLKRYREAADAFQTLLQQCPDSALRHEAREKTALLAEATGDLSGALDQYFTLQYDTDIAYMIDIRMTPPQLESYLRHREDEAYHHNFEWNLDEGRDSIGTRHEIIRYSLGIHYLRQGKWEQAKRWLATIPKEKYEKFSQGRKEWASRPSPDPLTAVKDLEKLQRAIHTAKRSEAKAKAAYRYASYYYTHGTLLLYNSLLWAGRRMLSFEIYWDKTLSDRQIEAEIRSYMYEHEVYARSLELCLDIARRYPHASVAPQALYRAACASHYLSNFNGWWRKEDKKQDHWKEAVRLMKQVTRRYPRHPLAKEAKKYKQVFQMEGGNAVHWNDY